VETTTIGGSSETTREVVMSVYRVIDVIGTSSSSWEEAAAEAISTAGESVRDIRVAEVTNQDIVIGDTGDLVYRTKIQLSFKYESD
jgi:dodecin